MREQRDAEKRAKDAEKRIEEMRKALIRWRRAYQAYCETDNPKWLARAFDDTRDVSLRRD